MGGLFHLVMHFSACQIFERAFLYNPSLVCCQSYPCSFLFVHIEYSATTQHSNKTLTSVNRSLKSVINLTLSHILLVDTQILVTAFHRPAFGQHYNASSGFTIE